MIIVLEDRFHDVHATHVGLIGAGEVERAALEFAETLAFEQGESFAYGIMGGADVGLARLTAKNDAKHGGAKWYPNRLTLK